MPLVNTTFNMTFSAPFRSASDTLNIGRKIEKTLALGVGLDQGDRIYRFYGSIGTGGTEFNLSDGSLKDLDGNAIVFVKAKAVIAYHDGLVTDVSNILRWGAGTNPAAWMGSAALDIGGPGSVGIKFAPTLAGLAVAAGSADRVKLIASAGTIPTWFCAVGTSS